VSLVAILDADKVGFLRSTRSLIQTIGRAARNLHGKAIMYAEATTDAMKAAIEETERRREKQKAHNDAHGITPKGVEKAVRDIIEGVMEKSPRGMRRLNQTAKELAETKARYGDLGPRELGKTLKQLEKRMHEHARNLEFEEAARLRDDIHLLKQEHFEVGS